MVKRQKIYCYVDETGQDAGSKFFIVACVEVEKDPEPIRSVLIELEQQTKIGAIKWHKSNYGRRIAFMEAFLLTKHSGLKVYFGRYKKPIPYGLPTVEVLQKSIQGFSTNPVQAIIYIDGLDRISALKITNALRSKYIYLNLVKGVRDESEVLIRLADRWAGCLRSAFAGNPDCEQLLKRAVKTGFLVEI